MVYFVYLFAYSMTNIKRLMYCTPKMSDNACSLHCYDTADNNGKVHWHNRSPKCARPWRISGTLCLNAPFARVCENSYFYEMAHVIIKCRVTFGKKMFNDCIKPHSICMRLVLSTQEEFSLKRAHYGHSPLPSYFKANSRSPTRCLIINRTCIVMFRTSRAVFKLYESAKLTKS